MAAIKKVVTSSGNVLLTVDNISVGAAKPTDGSAMWINPDEPGLVTGVDTVPTIGSQNLVTSDGIAKAIASSSVDPAGIAYPIFMALASKISTTNVELALGKGMESDIRNLGYALALYAKNEGETSDFTILKTCDSLKDIGPQGAASEVMNSPAIMDLLNSYEYGKEGIKMIFSTIFGNYDSALMALSSDSEGIMPMIRNTDGLFDAVFKNRQLITTAGSGEIEIPDNAETCVYILISEGGNALGYRTTDGCGKAGEYKQGVIDVRNKTTIAYSYSSASNTLNGVTVTKPEAGGYWGTGDIDKSREVDKLVSVGYDGAKSSNVDYGHVFNGWGGQGGFGGGDAVINGSSSLNLWGSPGAGYGGGAVIAPTSSRGTAVSPAKGPKQIGTGGGGTYNVSGASSTPGIGVIMYCFF